MIKIFQLSLWRKGLLMHNSFKLWLVFLGVACGCISLFFVMIFQPFHQQHVALEKEKKMMMSIKRDAEKIPCELQMRRRQMDAMQQRFHVISNLNELKHDLKIYQLSIISLKRQRNEFHLTLRFDKPQDFLRFLHAQIQKSRFLPIESFLIEPAQVSLVLRIE